MSDWYHPFRHWRSWLLFFFLWDLVNVVNGQLALRTLPLTAFRNKSSSGLGLYSKWSNGFSHQNLNSVPNIENELAAIFKGVAYGVNTEPPPTTTNTTTTTEKTTSTTPPHTTKVPVLRDSSNFEGLNDSEEREEWQEESGARPVVKSPIVEQDENDMIFYDSTTHATVPKVVKADIGISEIAWVSSLGIPWQIHVYVTAGLFSLLALLSLYCLARVHVTQQLLPKGYYITVHLLIFLASFFRCIFFFHDPYAVSHRLPAGLANLLFNTGTPCIITALAVLILALLRAARLRLLPLNLQSPIAVAIISGVLVVGSVLVDTLEGVIPEQQLASGLRAGIQALTAGWGSALCIGYVVIFSKIDRAAKRQQLEVLRLSFSRIHLEGTTLPQHTSKSSLSHGARATLIACITGLFLAILQVYGLMNSDGITTLPPRYPWIWFAYQSCCRFLELLLWTCVCIASSLPVNYAKNQRNQTGSEDSHLLAVFSCNGYCTSCSSISSCCYSDQKISDDMYSTICQSTHVARNYGHDEKCIIPQDTIATTRMNPKNISTTLLPPLSKLSQHNTSTLHSGGSDVHLLWNSTKSNSNSSNSSSRPSSLILTEGGLIKFRTHDPRNNNIKVFSFAKQNSSSTSQDTRNKIMLSCNGSGEDNYINSGALTPDEKLILEHSIRSGNVPIIVENKLCQSVNKSHVLQKANSFKSEGDIKGKYYGFAPTNYDIHVYEDGDQVCYQSPSLDSSMDSNGHLYASVLQPPYQRRPIPQAPQKKQQHEKILNSSSSFLSSPISHQMSTSPPQDMAQIDYLTDASQEYISPQHDNPNTFSSSVYSPQHDRSMSCSSPSHVYKCYVPKTMDNEANIIVSSYMTPKGSIHLEGHEDLLTSQGKINLFDKFVSNQSGMVYSPLCTDDISFMPVSDKIHNAFEEQMHKAAHRPRHAQLSPLPMHDHNIYTRSPQKSQRQIGHQVSRRGNECSQKQNQLSPHKDKTKQSHGNVDHDEIRIIDKFGCQQKLLSERIVTPRNEEIKDPSFNSSETMFINGSSVELQSDCVDTDSIGSVSRDTYEVRRPLRPQNNIA